MATRGFQAGNPGLKACAQRYGKTSVFWYLPAAYMIARLYPVYRDIIGGIKNNCIVGKGPEPSHVLYIKPAGCGNTAG
jgi:hypothetical protein